MTREEALKFLDLPTASSREECDVLIQRELGGLNADLRRAPSDAFREELRRRIKEMEAAREVLCSSSPASGFELPPVPLRRGTQHPSGSSPSPLKGASITSVGIKIAGIVAGILGVLFIGMGALIVSLYYFSHLPPVPPPGPTPNPNAWLKKYWGHHYSIDGDAEEGHFQDANNFGQGQFVLEPDYDGNFVASGKTHYTVSSSSLNDMTYEIECDVSSGEIVDGKIYLNGEFIRRLVWNDHDGIDHYSDISKTNRVQLELFDNYHGMITDANGGTFQAHISK